MNILLFIAILLLGFIGQSEATTYQVKKTGSDSSCTNATNGTGVLTIQKAFDCVIDADGSGADDIVEVWAGTYSETFDRPAKFPRGTSWDHPFTVKARNSVQSRTRGANGDVVIFRPTGMPLYRATGVDDPVLAMYQIWQGFKLDGGLLNGNANIIQPVYGTNLRFTNFEIYDWPAGDGTHAFEGGYDDIQIINNIWRDPRRDGTLCAPGNSGASCGYPIYLKASNSLIDNNLFYNLPGYAIHQYDFSAGLPGHPRPSNNIISGNEIHDFAIYQNSPAILLATGVNDSAFNNVIYDGGGSGISATCFTVGYVQTTAKIYNNTCYHVTNAGVEYFNTSNLTVANNIFYDMPNGKMLDAVPGTTSAITFTNNLCFGTGSNTNCAITSNPLFSNLAGRVFTLASTSSPAYNAGTPSPCPSTDYALTTRPQNGSCDIGAYEFGSSVPTPTIALVTIGGVANVGPTAVVITSTVTITGTSSCSVGTPSVTWVNDRGGSPGSGTATGTTSWTITSASLTPDRVNAFTITNACSLGGGTTSTTALVRANGASRFVLRLAMETGSGTTATDDSGLSNTATFAGSGNTWVTGKYGNGINFNGSGSLTIADADSLDLSTFTISAWVFPTSLSSTYRTVVRKNAGTTPDNYFLFATIDGGLGCSGGGDGSPTGGFWANAGPYRSACAPTPLSVNTWYYLSVTYDGRNLRFYRGTSTADLALLHTVPATDLMLEGTGTLQIAANTFGENFVGILDELEIANVALPLVNGAGDLCSQVAFAQASITRDMNCSITTPTPGAPAGLKVGSLGIGIGNKGVGIGQ